MVPGDVLNVAGEVVGHHDGLATYTIGQRRGLGIAAGKPQYVVALDAATNTVVLGDDDDLLERELACELAWLDESAAAQASPLFAQIRSRHQAQDARIAVVNGNVARVFFQTPQRAMAPGQTIAFYDGDVVVGSGVISAPGPA
jgi:tRNA-specific 2-thiouridylase